MIKAIFFDVGGTLCRASSGKGEEPSFKKILANITHREVTDFDVKKQSYLWTSSLPKRELIIRLCQDLGITDWKIVYEELEKYSYNVSLYEDVEPCLKSLDKYRLGLLSNTTVWTAFDHSRLGLGYYIKTSILSSDVGIAKPNHKIFDYAREVIGVEPRELLYIGDTIEYDIKPALMANWKAILLCRYRRTKCSIVPTISGLSELKNKLMEI